MNQIDERAATSRVLVRIGLVAVSAVLIASAVACSKPAQPGGGQSRMPESTFEKAFSRATSEFGKPYTEARETILSLPPEEQAKAMSLLKEAAADASSWKRQLTAEIVMGWMTQRAEFARCGDYMRGKLPPPRPLPGYTAQHRAKAIAAMGEKVTPRVLEMAYKSREYTDDEQSAAVFGALAFLEDRRAVLPMIALLEENPSDEIKGRAINVLSATGDPRGIDPILRVARDPEIDRDIRVSAIGNLSRFQDPRAIGALVEILGNDQLSVEERAAAAYGLRDRADPTTRKPIAAVLAREQDEEIQVVLIRTLGDIGTPSEIPVLKKIASGGSRDIRTSVEEAIANIEQRRPENPSPP